MIVRFTIWLALCLLVAAEVGFRRAAITGREPRWARPSFVAGAVLCVAHALAAYHFVHHWDQQAVLRETARQTHEVFGLAWGGGAYVNLVFIGCWIFVAWWRHRAAMPSRPRRSMWIARAFFLLIIANGAVVFVHGPARWLGVLLVTALLWAWWPVPQKVLSPAGRVVT